MPSPPKKNRSYAERLDLCRQQPQLSGAAVVSGPSLALLDALMARCVAFDDLQARGRRSLPDKPGANENRLALHYLKLAREALIATLDAFPADVPIHDGT